MNPDASITSLPQRSARDPRVDALFAELELALAWDRPSILIAVYDLPATRKKAARRLSRRLANRGADAIEIPLTESRADILLALRDHPSRARGIFMVSGFTPVDGLLATRAFKSLNIRRELLVDHKIRVVFWLTEAEVIALARAAPDFWAFRHCVVDVFSSPGSIPGALGLEAHLAAFEQPVGQAAAALDARIAYRENQLDAFDTGDWVARFDLHMGLARLWSEKNEPGQAFQHMRAALGLAQSARDSMRQCLAEAGYAILLTAAGNLDAALAAYHRAEALDPDQPGIKVRMSALYAASEQTGLALALAQLCVARWPQFQPGWRHLGWLLGNLGRLDEARNACNRALALNPSDALSHYSLGLAQSVQGDRQAACASLQRAARLDGSRDMFWQALASELADLGQPGRALRCARRAVRLATQDARAWLALAGMLCVLGRFPEAARACERAHTLAQDETVMHAVSVASLFRLATLRRKMREAARWQAQVTAGLQVGHGLARAAYLLAAGDETAAQEVFDRLRTTNCVVVHLFRHAPVVVLAEQKT